MDFKQNRINLDTAKDGVWVEMDDAKLLIAHWMNDKQRGYITRRMEPYNRGRPGAKAKQIDDDLAEEILAESVARHVLLGWENLQEDGVDLVYSSANAVKLLTDKTIRWFYEFVVSQSQDIGLFIQEAIEVEVESVGKPLSGTSPGEGTAKAS